MNLSPLPIQKFFSNNGRPLSGGLLFTYTAGTSNKLVTYVDSSGGTPNTNPIVLDFRGECRLWIDPSLSYKFVLAPEGDTDPPASPIWSVDNITTAPINFENSAVDTGSVNNIALAIPQISSPVAFTRVIFKALNTNTAATTISINVGTSKSLKWQNGAALAGGEIQSNGIYEAIYDGAQWQLQGPTLQPPQIRTAAEIAAAVVPSNYAYLPGNILRYGADPSGVADSSAAIQAAIDAHPEKVYIPKGTYKYSTALTTTTAEYLHIYGDHMRTSKLNWTGGASVCLTLEASTEAEIENITFENNGTATICIHTNTLHTRLHRVWMLPTVEFSTAIIRTRTDDVIEELSITESMMGGGTTNRSPIGLFVQQGNNVVLYNTTFENLLVCVQAGKTPVGAQESGLIRSLCVTGCLFQSTTAIASNIAIDLFTVKGFSITGSYFQMSGFVVSPNDLSIKLRAAEGGVIAGNMFDGGGQQNYAIEATSANARNVQITGNLFRRIVLGGAQITAGTQIQVDNNTLDAGSCPTMAVQTNNTFSPGVDFGGASVGITYGTRVGRFQRQGNWVFVQGTVTFTSKGSSTGQARITDLPLSSEPTASNNPLLNVAFINGATLAGHLCAIVSNNATTATLQAQGAASVAGLTDVNFTNTTTVFFTGAYQVADV